MLIKPELSILLFLARKIALNKSSAKSTIKVESMISTKSLI